MLKCLDWHNLLAQSRKNAGETTNPWMVRLLLFWRVINTWLTHQAHALIFVGFAFAACSGTMNDGNPSSGGVSNTGSGGASGFQIA